MSVKRKNVLLILICFLAYAISYIGKYSYSTNINNVITTFGVTKAQAGFVTSCFFFCYGAGQFINGLLSERLNSKRTVCLALIGSAALTLSMFFTGSIYVMTVLWGLNGYVLSALWCHCIKLLATIRDKSYVGRAITVMSLTLPAGIVSAYGTSALFTYLGVWKFAYIFSAVLLAGVAAAFFFVVTATEEAPEPAAVREQKEEPRQMGLLQFFGVAMVPIFLIAACTGIVRDGSSTWMPVLLAEAFSMPDFFSILVTLGLPFMGVFTAVIATVLMNRLKSIMASAQISGVLALAVGAVLCLAWNSNAATVILLFMLLSLAAYILGNTLTSVLPLYYKGKLKSGQTAGVVNSFIYLGSAVSSFSLGGLVDGFGWPTFMLTMLLCAAAITLSALLGLALLRNKKRS